MASVACRITLHFGHNLECLPAFRSDAVSNNGWKTGSLCAGPNGAVIAPELVNEAMAAASLIDVLLKLTGEAGYTFVEPIVRCAFLVWK